VTILGLSSKEWMGLRTWAGPTNKNILRVFLTGHKGLNLTKKRIRECSIGKRVSKPIVLMFF